MTWREQIVARILLMVAGMFAGEGGLQDEIRHLRNTITNTRLDTRPVRSVTDPPPIPEDLP